SGCSCYELAIHCGCDERAWRMICGLNFCAVRVGVQPSIRQRRGATGMRQHFQMFAAYNRWANAAVYDAAAQLDDAALNHDTGAFFGSLLGTLNHVLVADRIWLKRFTGEGAAPAALDATLHADLPALRAART